MESQESHPTHDSDCLNMLYSQNVRNSQLQLTNSPLNTICVIQCKHEILRPSHNAGLGNYQQTFKIWQIDSLGKHWIQFTSRMNEQFYLAFMCTENQSVLVRRVNKLTKEDHHLAQFFSLTSLTQVAGLTKTMLLNSHTTNSLESSCQAFPPLTFISEKTSIAEFAIINN